MIRAVFVTLGCATALMSATVVSWSLSPNPAEATVKVSQRVKTEGSVRQRTQLPDVRVVYVGYGATSSGQQSSPVAPTIAPATERPVLVTERATSAANGILRIEPLKKTTLVDLNTASLDELNTRIGGGLIGKAILKGRPYQSPDDLIAKRVVSRAKFEVIKSRISVSS